MDNVTIEEARAAKAIALERFQSVAGVVGVGITKVRGDYAVKVNLAEPVGEGTIPTHVHGVPVQVEITGSITPRI